MFLWDLDNVLAQADAAPCQQAREARDGKQPVNLKGNIRYASIKQMDTMFKLLTDYATRRRYIDAGEGR